ncbi:calcium-binding protein [Caenimonas sp. SL110]|uniref:beta strand repeat-containing protein n=1 Tax=Caenimonas sp. SL110 TaxID=1450524 RepID=UPI000652B5B5|nr:calcium-binding protein [Caenimonas sp. SL110]
MKFENEFDGPGEEPQATTAASPDASRPSNAGPLAFVFGSYITTPAAVTFIETQGPGTISNSVRLVTGTWSIQNELLIEMPLPAATNGPAYLLLVQPGQPTVSIDISTAAPTARQFNLSVGGALGAFTLAVQDFSGVREISIRPSFGGDSFWTDLFQALHYSNTSDDPTGDALVSQVNFSFIPDGNTPTPVTVVVASANEAPTLSAFTPGAIKGIATSGVPITLQSLLAAGNEQDVDNAVTAFVVNSVVSGTLIVNGVHWYLGDGVIDATRSALWFPPVGQTGSFNPFAVVAKDASGGVSALPVAVNVKAVINPTFTAMTGPVANGPEDASIRISLADIAAASNAADADGSVTSYVITSVTSGTLYVVSEDGIYTDGLGASIDATHYGWWFPPANANGVKNAFTIVAQDNDGGRTTVPVTAQVNLTAVNDAPQVNLGLDFDVLYESQGPGQISNAVSMAVSPTITDVDSTELAKLTITLRGAISPSGTVLNQEGTGLVFRGTLIDLSSSGATGTLDVNGRQFQYQVFDRDSTRVVEISKVVGNGAIADFSYVLENLKYTNTSDNPLESPFITYLEVSATDANNATSANSSFAVQVQAVNDLPTFTTLSGPVGTAVEDQGSYISTYNLNLASNFQDLDSEFGVWVVKEVTSGTLYTRQPDGGYLPWQAEVNDWIRGSDFYWIPPANVTGTIDAFTVIARDTAGGLSSPPVQAKIVVTPVNDPPTLSQSGLEFFAKEAQQRTLTLDQVLEVADEADIDGTVVAFVVSGLSMGVMRIGTDAATAQPWVAGSNDTIDATHQAYWTPYWANAPAPGGLVYPFSVAAKDNMGGVSTSHQVKFTVEPAPVLTTMAGPVTTVKEDTLGLVTWVDLMIQGNESNEDAPVDAFVVRSVTSGTLLIRDTVDRVAAPWVAGVNDIIDVEHSAYWTPPADWNGVLDAFTVVARDTEGDVSLVPVQVEVNVTSVNDKPTLTAMSRPAASTLEDGQVEITLQNLMAQGNESDVDGDVVDFVVKAVVGGALLIGADAATALPWAIDTNDTIDADNNAYWSGAANENGTLNAFTVVARDDEGATSAAEVLVQVFAESVNDIPTVTAMLTDPIATLAPNTQYPITLDLLRTHSNAADVDGAVTGFVVQQVFSGSLLVRNDAGIYAPWSWDNQVIDAMHPGLWTSNATTLGNLSAFVIGVVDSSGAMSTTAAVSVNFFIEQPNRSPTLTAMATPVASTASAVEVEIPFSSLMTSGNEADSDGTVVSYVVTSVTSGTLWIGETRASAVAWIPSANDTITTDPNSNVNLKAFWTSDPGASGMVNAFKVVVKDDDGASSLPPVQVQVTVTLPNTIPTLTSMAAPVVSVDEDVQVFISLANLKAQGDEADVNGSVDAFVVKSVTSGTLLIRDSAGNAVAWAPGSNDTIDATHGAYWKAGPNANGVFNAFTVVAKDNSGAESVTAPVQVQVTVNSINDKPTMSAMAGPVATTAEDTAAVITLAGLQATANESDAEGPLNTFVVKTVTTGTMRIGVDEASATAWAAGTNDAVTATLNAYWTPAANASGTLNAFTVIVRDDESLVSSSVQAQVSVTPVNDAPTLTAFASAVDTALPGGQTQVTMAELAAKGNEADVDGAVSGFVVRAVSSGTLLIGTSAGVATAWSAGVNGVGANDVIDASRHAFWTPDLQSTGTVTAFTVVARDSAGAESTAAVPVSITISDPGSAASGTSGADYLSGGVGNDTIRGLGGNDTLLGLAGDDVIDGGSGTDSLNGGDGSDVYMFLASEHPAAEIFDNGLTGVDEVRFAATTTTTLLLMAGDIGVERVVIGTGGGLVANTSGVAGAGANASALGAAVSMLGNAGVNPLTGTRFNDTIDGGPGADVMTGGNGDDTFYVDNAGDKALDSSSTGGFDTVIASVSYTIAANVESLVLAGSALNGTGNASANTLAGNAGANVLSGMDGHDTIDGAGGDDTLAGGKGNDWLTGGQGADKFRFDTFPHATTNKDIVVDFVSGTDILQFKVSIFTKLGLAGVLDEAKFWSGAGVVKGHDTTDRIVYDTTTGTLYYDSDGSGIAAAIAVAVIGVDQHPLLTPADFILV